MVKFIGLKLSVFERIQLVEDIWDSFLLIIGQCFDFIDYFDELEVEAIQEVLCTLDQRTEKMAKSA
ncbi:MAG: hypothetical protein WCI64_11760 [Chlorobium sp.]